MIITIVVIDGFGAGAMPDAGSLRPGDVQADTAAALYQARTADGDSWRIPNLRALGLGLIDKHIGIEPPLPGVTSIAHRVGLGYPGADTFAGHQTMMGADMSHATVCLLADRADEVKRTLADAGHEAEGDRFIRVGDHIIVHDNLEADPGLNWNVTGRTNKVSFKDILEVARTVRAVAPVARVIAVGGRTENELRSYVREGPQDTIGIDTPATGIYANGSLEVVHLGVPIDHANQLPERAARKGVDVTLIGKAADILVTDSQVCRLPGVDTGEILGNISQTLAAARNVKKPALIVANVQQTDLAGHQQDVLRFAGLVEQVDSWVGDQLPLLGPDEVLIITADHGNDPTIGHAFHTREYVPALIVRAGETSVTRGEDVESLASVGSLAASLLGVGSLGHGEVAGMAFQAN